MNDYVEPGEDVPEEVEPSGYAEQHFAHVPMGVLTSGASHRAMVVYAMLRCYVRPGHATFPRIATVAEAFGIPERTVQRGIAELQEAGLLVVGKRTSPRGFRRANQYYFPNLPDRIKDTSNMAGPSASNLAVTTASNVAVNNLSNLAEQEVEKLEVEKTEVEAPRKRGTTTSIPKGWQPGPDLLSWAKEKHPRLDVSRETAKFINHFIAKGTRYKDWNQAWRNWLDRAAEWSEPTPIRPTAVQPTIELDPYGDPRWA